MPRKKLFNAFADYTEGIYLDNDLAAASGCKALPDEA